MAEQTTSKPAIPKRTSLTFIFFLTLLITVWHSKVYVPSIKENAELKAQIYDCETERAVLRMKLEKEKCRIRKIRENDPYLLEMYVRSELGWLGPNEVCSAPYAPASDGLPR